MIGRLNVVRIVVGLVLIHRYGSNAVALLYLPASPEQVAAVTFELVGAGLLTIGLLTPIAAMALFLFQQQADRLLLSWSLGSMVLQMVLLPLAVLPAGTRWSLDARYRDRAMLRAIYALWGTPTEARAAALRLMAFVAYGVVSLSAVQFHLADPLWRSGLAQAYVFTNPYFSRYADVVQVAVERWPTVALAASMAATAAMLSWEAFMLPLALVSARGRRVVAGYGLLFFASSALFLHLAWLPYLELCLWALVFWVAPGVRLSTRALADDWRLAVVTVFCVIGLVGAVSAFPWIGADNPVPLISERFGAQNVDVFNHADLRANESYVTVARLGVDGTATPLPFNDRNGGRQRWHFAERTYYGISLPWRRVRIGHADECWSETIDRPWMDQLVALDRGTGAPRDARYVVTFYAEPLPTPPVGNLGVSRGRPRATCQVLVEPANVQVLMSAVRR